MTQENAVTAGARTQTGIFNSEIPSQCGRNYVQHLCPNCRQANGENEAGVIVECPSCNAEYRVPARPCYGVWGFTFGFLGGVDSIKEAKALIEATRKRLPSIKLFDVHKCEPGFYFQNKRVYSEGYPRNQQDLLDDLHNHRCSMDHPPCPACELQEEREYEREAGL